MDTNDLAPLVIRKRGNMGIRAAAGEIGISPTTLSRVEKGHVPDMATLTKICDWIGEAPAMFTGIGGLQIAFKNKKTTPVKTAQAMAKSIKLAAEQFQQINTVGH